MTDYVWALTEQLRGLRAASELYQSGPLYSKGPPCCHKAPPPKLCSCWYQRFLKPSGSDAAAWTIKPTVLLFRKCFLPGHGSRKSGWNLFDIKSLSPFLISLLHTCSVRTYIFQNICSDFSFSTPTSHGFIPLLFLPPSLAWQERKGWQRQDAERKNKDMQNPHLRPVPGMKDEWNLCWICSQTVGNFFH